MLRSSIHRLSIITAAILTATLVTPALATDTSFAQYRSTGTSFSTTNTSGTFNIAESANATFSFLQNNLSNTIANVSATMSLRASAPNSNFDSAVIANQTYLATSGLNGSYTFTSTQAYTIGKTVFAAGSNLLTVVFTNADLSGALNSPNATLTGSSTNGETVTYTSAFLNFANVSVTDFAISLGAVNPLLSGTHYFNPFTATPTGTFSSAPVPISVAVVPEPATWALMLTGLSAIGLGLRRSLRRNLRTA